MKHQEVITVGVAARNEEKTIHQSLLTAFDSLRQHAGSDKYEVIVCLNGCIDNTEKIVQAVIDEMAAQSQPLPIKMIHSQEGLIHAQRAIIAARSPGSTTIFIDADLLIDRQCIAELAKAMTADRSIQIAWARVIPYDAQRPSYKHLILNFADYHPEVLTDRVYFSGRAFAVRDYDVPFTAIDLQTVDAKLVDFLRLSTGPIIDDVFLLRSIIHQYGPEGIRYVPSAKVYFQPISSLKDFFYSQRRTILERKRLNLLFPQHSYVVGKYYKRTLRAEVYATLPRSHKVAYRLYGVLYASVRRIALTQYWMYTVLLKRGWRISSSNIWPALKTTKKAFDHEPTN